ncbi:glycosyltransferase [Neoroseomonas oryzicola]|uniref:Glycosyltransferase n=1 Tax=Neoroseomonas oryzicola TaxID=535904 RepID=A0A9X9WJK8_9PROT|nr:glycosyltransferase [Neoroseomonas oryzicola]MBR0660518.1 glycosyltransferase [Neoroseomonas oryzicola]NKE16760.1 glycosyltransferase [Neoroseomonas oryzicola]
MRIAFFGLGYHARTGSSRFFLDLLERLGEVDTFFAEADVADVRRRCAGFVEDRYDAIVIWQLHEAFALLSGRHPNVTFAPMYDAMVRGGAFVWKPSWNAAKILCFSWALRAEVMRRAPLHAHVQYFPDPAQHPAVTDFDTLRGFLWYRRRDIPPEAAFALTEGTPFASLAIHDAPDPGHDAPWNPAAPPHVATLTRTAWGEDRGAFDAALRGANVFFASRPLEGIGMSFLEAMAAGLCVVAPDAPTMNEVISHGANGLLYPPGSRAPLDFGDARRIGARARESVAIGRRRFEAAVPGLLEFVATPFAALARTAGRRGILLPARPATAAPEIGIVLDGTMPATSWILAPAAGDAVAEPAMLAAALAGAPPEAVAIRGHHLVLTADGAEHLRRTADIAAAWSRLTAGSAEVAGFGMPAATLLRADALRRIGASPPATPPELGDLLLRWHDEGALIHDADEVLATCPESDDRAGWIALVERRAGPAVAGRLRDAFAVADTATAEAARRTRPARIALDCVAAADRLSPALGRLAESMILGGGLRRLRSMLAGKRARGEDGAA